MKKFLQEGLVAGAAGGVAAAVYLLLVVDPVLSKAIALEHHTESGHEEMFSRFTQQIGGALGTVLYGALLGVILGVAVAMVRHRLAGGDRQRVLHVAAVGFVSVLLVPTLKFPPNPPGVGDPTTIGRRTALYLALLALSVLAAWSGWRLRRTLDARGWAGPDAVTAGIGAYALAMALAGWLLPGAGNTIDLSPTLLWQFRIGSIGGGALLMAVTAVVLGRRLSAADPVLLPEAAAHA